MDRTHEYPISAESIVFKIKETDEKNILNQGVID